MPPETWLPLFEWLENTSVGTAVRNSLWLFPVVEGIHLIGLGLLGGAILVVDLRLLGVGLKRQVPAELIRHTQPWLIGAIVLLAVTGITLFLSEAVKCYYNTSFWVKITTLPIAIIFTFTVRKWLLQRLIVDTSWQTRLLGVLSLALWFTVAAGGRWIGYS